MDSIEKIIERYNYILDITKYNKEKSKKYGEVFTPDFLVDKMINRISDEKWITNFTTLDMCAGIGQFTMGIIRKKSSLIEDFDVDYWLSNYHYFNELQDDSVKKLFYIFGDNINMFHGDARKLPELGDVKGYWVYDDNIGWNYENSLIYRENITVQKIGSM